MTDIDYSQERPDVAELLRFEINDHSKVIFADCAPYHADFEARAAQILAQKLVDLARSIVVQLRAILLAWVDQLYDSQFGYELAVFLGTYQS